MKFDTTIIGGGLSALVCGLELQRNGRTTAIVSSGQSSLFFFSGAFGLLSRLPDGTFVDRPLDVLESLPETHPYSKAGAGNVRRYASEFRSFFESCGVKLNGCDVVNGWRFMAGGGMKRAWASLPDLELFQTVSALAGRKALVVRIPGFLDHFPVLIAESLGKGGCRCRVADVTVPEMEVLRTSSNVVRSLSIAKVVEQPEVLDAFIAAVSSAVSDEDVVILPQIFGLKSDEALRMIRESLKAEVLFFNTMTPSVPGNRLYSQLRAAYEAAGGTFISGTVRSGNIAGGMLEDITVDGQEEPVEADSYVLATGSFASRGLVSTSESVSEPVFGLDVDALRDRSLWTSEDMDARQGYLSSGVRTDESFRACFRGETVRNLYACGSVLSGADSLYEGSGAGVAVITALRVSDLILGR